MWIRYKLLCPVLNWGCPSFSHWFVRALSILRILTLPVRDGRNVLSVYHLPLNLVCNIYWLGLHCCLLARHLLLHAAMALHTSHIEIEIHHFPGHPALPAGWLVSVDAPPFSWSPRLELLEASLVPDMPSVASSQTFSFCSFSGRQPLFTQQCFRSPLFFDWTLQIVS